MKRMASPILSLALLMAAPLAAATAETAPAESAPAGNAPAASATAPASPAVTPLEKVFQQVDGDLNGEVTREELKAQPRAALLLENFSKIDKNKSNSLSLKEVQDFLMQLRKDQEAFLKAMKDADKDGDGAWTRKELKSAKGKLSSLEKNFKAIDVNKDGKITEEEIAAFSKRL